MQTWPCELYQTLQLYTLRACTIRGEQLGAVGILFSFFCVFLLHIEILAVVGQSERIEVSDMTCLSNGWWKIVHR